MSDRHTFSRGYNDRMETPYDIIDKEENLKQLFAEYFEKYLNIQVEIRKLKEKEKLLNTEYKEYGLKISKVKAAAKEYMRRALMSEDEKEAEQVIFNWVNTNERLRDNLKQLLLKNPEEHALQLVELDDRIAKRLTQTRERAEERDSERGIGFIDYKYAETMELIKQGWTSPKAFRELQKWENLRAKRDELVKQGLPPTIDLVEPQTSEQFQLVDKQEQAKNHDEGKLYDGNHYVPEWLEPYQEEAKLEREVSDFISTDWWELGKILWELHDHMKRKLDTELPWEPSKLREINPKDLCLDEMLNLREISRWLAVNSNLLPIQKYDVLEDLIDERTQKIEDKTLSGEEHLIETIGKYEKSKRGFNRKKDDLIDLIDVCDFRIKDNDKEHERAKHRATRLKAEERLKFVNIQIEENANVIEELKALLAKDNITLEETDEITNNTEAIVCEYGDKKAKREYGNVILWQKPVPWLVGEEKPVNEFGDYLGEIQRYQDEMEEGKRASEKMNWESLREYE